MVSGRKFGVWRIGVTCVRGRRLGTRNMYVEGQHRYKYHLGVNAIAFRLQDLCAPVDPAELGGLTSSLALQERRRQDLRAGGEKPYGDAWNSKHHQGYCAIGAPRGYWRMGAAAQAGTFGVTVHQARNW
jgi:hypothetical protein